MPKIFKDKNNNILYTGYETSEVVANPTLVGTEANLTGIQIGDTKYKVPEGGGSADLGLQYQSTRNVAGLFYTDLYMAGYEDQTLSKAYLNSSKLKQILIDANFDLDTLLDEVSYIDLWFTLPCYEYSDSVQGMIYKNFRVKLNYHDDAQAGKEIYVSEPVDNSPDKIINICLIADFEGTTWSDLFDYLIENPNKYFEVLFREQSSNVIQIGEDILSKLNNFDIDVTLPVFSTVYYIDWEATDVYFADVNYIDVMDLRDAIEYVHTNE